MTNKIKSGMNAKAGHGESRGLNDAKSLLLAMLEDKDLRIILENLPKHREEINKYVGSDRQLSLKLRALNKKVIQLNKAIEDTMEQFLY